MAGPAIRPAIKNLHSLSNSKVFSTFTPTSKNFLSDREVGFGLMVGPAISHRFSETLSRYWTKYLLVLESGPANRVGLAEGGGGALSLALDEEGDEEDLSGAQRWKHADTVRRQVGGKKQRPQQSLSFGSVARRSVQPG